MARTEDKRETVVEPQRLTPEQIEDDKREDEQREDDQRQEESRNGDDRQEQQFDHAPKLTVIGIMDTQIAIRLAWRTGMVAISQSRFRFLRDDLGMEVTDDPEHYLF